MYNEPLLTNNYTYICIYHIHIHEFCLYKYNILNVVLCKNVYSDLCIVYNIFVSGTMYIYIL